LDDFFFRIDLFSSILVNFFLVWVLVVEYTLWPLFYEQ